MAKGAYIGVNGVARKIEKGYIGVKESLVNPNKAFSGQTSNGNMSVQGQRVTFHYIEGKDTYFFIPLTQTLLKEKAYTVSFDCSGIDDGTVLTILIDNNASNPMLLKNGRMSRTFIPAKDIAGQLLMDDTAPWTNVIGKEIVLSNFRIEESDANSVARKLKKAYIGVNGVARLFYEKPLSAYSWAEISAIAQSGEAQNYFAVGDCKEIVLNGTVGTLEFSDYKTYVYIIGFDHNGATNTIDFGTFKTSSADSDSIGLSHDNISLYSVDGTKYYNMNHWGNYTHGGWKGCDLRYDILGSTDVAPSGYGSAVSSGRTGYDATATCATVPVANTLMAALPSDLRSVMKPMTVYTDNVGGGGDTASKVSSSVDYLPLRSEYEVYGVRKYANSAEQNYQTQYAYYAMGNSAKIHSHHDPNGETLKMNAWLRSQRVEQSAQFATVFSAYGSVSSGHAGYSYIIAPIFRV